MLKKWNKLSVKHWPQTFNLLQFQKDEALKKEKYVRVESRKEP